MSQLAIGQLLPDLYSRFLPELFANLVPKERYATCDDCAMCRSAGAVHHMSSIYFSERSKCCTYHPDLPNYMVGAVLASRDPGLAEGRRRIRKKIRNRLGVTPHGALAPPRYRMLYRNSPRAFGRALALVCPYYDTDRGACTIWPYREAAAVTFFCKHNHGADGSRFWEALNDYLVNTEQLLACFALDQLGWPADTILGDSEGQIDLLPHEVDDQAPDESTYEASWRHWVGREEAFFIRAHEAVLRLSPRAFEQLGGIHQALLLKRLEDRYREMISPRLPDPLVRNPSMEVERTEGGYLLMSYRRTDPVLLRKELYDLLDFFDGRSSNAQVLHLIRRQERKEISRALLTSMYQHRVLVEPPTHPRRGPHG